MNEIEAMEEELTGNKLSVADQIASARRSSMYGNKGNNNSSSKRHWQPPVRAVTSDQEDDDDDDDCYENVKIQSNQM